jgi:hypothetical protein
MVLSSKRNVVILAIIKDREKMGNTDWRDEYG